MLAIEADALRRTYTSRTGWPKSRRTESEAVRGVTFDVAPGELFGLLGPNGAGKTTTIKMLNTLLLPTSGTARVFGHDVARDPVAVRRRIGYVFGGDRGLYDRLSALDNLRYFAELYGVPARAQKRRITELLDLVGLLGREKEKVEGSSRPLSRALRARAVGHLNSISSSISPLPTSTSTSERSSSGMERLSVPWPYSSSTSPPSRSAAASAASWSAASRRVIERFCSNLRSFIEGLRSGRNGRYRPL